MILSDTFLVYARGLPSALELRHQFPLETIDIEDVDRASFVVKTVAKSFVVAADSTRETEAWRLAIATAAQQRRANLAAAPPDAFAPVWIEDADSNACQQCGATFTLLRRRHHCRKCGRLVCHACSADQIPIAGSQKLARVCDPCRADYVDNGRAYGVDRHRGPPAAPAAPALPCPAQPPPLPPRR